MMRLVEGEQVEQQYQKTESTGSGERCVSAKNHRVDVDQGS